jgi:protein-S-isoprenylcysteine O-methyltransferase Ste14
LGTLLRRWAELCFVAALLPSLIVSLFFPEGIGVAFSRHPMAMTAAVLLAVAVAYAAYAIRRWMHDDPTKKQLRMAEKTPIERSRRQQDLFAFLADNQPPQGPPA